MSKTKVILRVNTVGAKAGDEIEVDREVAEQLVENGNALRVKDAPQSKKD